MPQAASQPGLLKVMNEAAHFFQMVPVYLHFQPQQQEYVVC